MAPPVQDARIQQILEQLNTLADVPEDPEQQTEQQRRWLDELDRLLQETQQADAQGQQQQEQEQEQRQHQHRARPHGGPPRDDLSITQDTDEESSRGGVRGQGRGRGRGRGGGRGKGRDGDDYESADEELGRGADDDDGMPAGGDGRHAVILNHLVRHGERMGVWYERLNTWLWDEGRLQELRRQG